MDGLANLNPITNNIAANADNGIIFKMLGINITVPNKKNPCKTAASFCSASSLNIRRTTYDYLRYWYTSN